ncbi:glycosyltransferase [Muribaculaceae bacterium Isolate-002 (NCI)]|nr:glycosyltransferase [Muribaculaceae bacterium Isolate-002 (NCI)]
MTIVFFSNVLNHHQVALCDELYRQNGGDFYFIETGRLNASRRSMGFRRFERPYAISLADNGNGRAVELAKTADVAIMGAESYPYLKLRMEAGYGVTFSYSERWLKQGIKNILSPNLLKQIRLYLLKGRKRKWYMLAASGYLANDLARIGIFKDRIFKWGYFPGYPEAKPNERNTDRPVRILWAARFIDWKRPDIMIKLAEMLQANNYDFEMTMIGDGDMAKSINSLISSSPETSPRIKLKGNIPNEEVLSEMSRSDIYCFTSTRREGWGAVLGEAMATGCCPVASSDAGATPFLVDDGRNGLVFRTDDINDLYDKVAYLIDNPDARIKMGEAAKATMLNDWCASTAAREFLSLSKKALAGTLEKHSDSNLPASPAYRIKLMR